MVAAGVSLVVEDCGGKGGVCAQALTLSEEMKKDVDASRRARNGMNAPDQRGLAQERRYANQQSHPTRFRRRLRRPQTRP